LYLLRLYAGGLEEALKGGHDKRLLLPLECVYLLLLPAHVALSVHK